MPRFNFNEIALSGQADISKIQENFEELETNGISFAEVKGKNNYKAISKSKSVSRSTSNYDIR